MLFQNSGLENRGEDDLCVGAGTHTGNESKNQTQRLAPRPSSNKLLKVFGVENPIQNNLTCMFPFYDYKCHFIMIPRANWQPFLTSPSEG